MPLHGTYAPFLHNTITRLAGVDRTYSKMESTDMDAFLAYARSEECCGSAVTMCVGPPRPSLCCRRGPLDRDETDTSVPQDRRFSLSPPPTRVLTLAV